ncbi:MAG: single-stranded DNA-binding protein [Anaerolineales bacterium]|nr:single-stranded DNA-binding protein [Anaerolineales bacterium]MCB9128012.1 single-stranded DNA-binding protein [Ardenticatenales bacterium]MCB9172028.1 single-stranded DNA-binding protein [Ardenticatenales bacterium]
MVGLNKIMIIGRVGRRPEMRFTPSGVAVAHLSVAVPRQWTTSHGEQRHATEWFNVVAWNSLAEQCREKCVEDALVYVEGSLQTRSWEDAQGTAHQRVELVAEQLSLLDGAKP